MTAEPVIRRATRLRGVVGRALSATLVVTATTAVAAVGTFDPPPRPVAAEGQVVAVPPMGADLVCPGPLRLPTEQEAGEDVVYDPAFDPRAAESITSLRGVALDGTGIVWADLGTVDRRASAQVDAVLEGAGESAQVLHATPPTQNPLAGAAAFLARTSAGDLRGLAAASCQVASAESWLVGGSTSVGSSARLVLQNPGRTAASVEVSLWGPTGQVELAGAPEFLVPAGAERVVHLEGVAAEQRSLVARVRSTGGLVAAYIQDSELRGLTPAGVDLVVAGSEPQRDVVLPGLSVTASAPDGSDTAALRLLAPEVATTARVQILGPEGTVDLPGASEVTLAAGEVLDVPLGGLPEGIWSVVVRADAPVVAGALLTRGTTTGGADAGSVSLAPLDRAWVPGLPTADSGDPAGLVALPAGVAGASGPDESPTGLQGTVSLVSPPGSRPAELRIEVLDATGAVAATRDVSLAPGTSAAVPLAELAVADPSAVRVTSSRGAAAWAVVLVEVRADGDVVAVIAPATQRVVRTDVAVRVR